MTRMEYAIAADPSVSPQALVMYHCPFEFGMETGRFPDDCPADEWPCLRCWNEEVSE